MIGKGKIAVGLLQWVVGKNAAHIARKLQTFIGGFLLSSALFEPGSIDSAINPDGYIPLIPGEISDGLTTGETVRAIIGFILIWGSRVISYLRARNLDWAAEWVGLLIGRSIHSLTRALMTVYASILAYLGIQGGESMDIEKLLTAAIVLVVNGIYSKWQDEQDNPVDSSPDKNNIFG